MKDDKVELVIAEETDNVSQTDEISEVITATNSAHTQEVRINKWKDSIAVKTIAYGLNGFFFSAYIVGNGKFIAALGDNQAGAGTLVSPYQSVILGSSVGFCLGAGLEMSALVGKENYRAAGNTAKAAWLLNAALGGIGSIAMLSTRWIFPLMFELETAKAAGDFFTGCSLGNIPMLMIVTDTQIGFNEGHWFIPPGVACILFGSTTALSYLLAFRAELGALGIGLGGSLAQIGVCAGLKLWFLQDTYKKYQLHQKLDAPLKEILTKLLSTGWKLSLQRLTEWGNLMLIATSIGIHSNKDLKASNPSIQYMGLIAASLQGIAQATGMLVVRNKGTQAKALEQKNNAEAMKWNHINKMTIIQSNAIALLLNGAIAGTFYFCREPLADFFLADTEDHDTHVLAETLLWVNMLGLLPDATRIISAGALRAWGDILWPTMMSLLTMIVLGLPVGYGLGEFFSGDVPENNEATWMFYTRDITMLMASLLILIRCRNQVQADYRSITAQNDESIQPELVDEEQRVEASSTTTRPSVNGNRYLFLSATPSAATPSAQVANYRP